MEIAHLIKYDAVKLDDGSILFIMNFVAKGMIDRCIVKVDSEENWKSTIDNLVSVEPGNTFVVSDLGIQDSPYPLKYTQGRILTRSYMHKLLKSKFFGKKLRNPTEFVNEEFYMLGNVTKPYLRKYAFKGSGILDILDMMSIPKGVWLVADKERSEKRKKPRIIM